MQIHEIRDYKPPRHYQLERLNEYRKPEPEPTLLEAWLAGIALVIVIGWLLLGVTG